MLTPWKSTSTPYTMRPACQLKNRPGRRRSRRPETDRALRRRGRSRARYCRCRTSKSCSHTRDCCFGSACRRYSRLRRRSRRCSNRSSYKAVRLRPLCLLRAIQKHWLKRSPLWRLPRPEQTCELFGEIPRILVTAQFPGSCFNQRWRNSGRRYTNRQARQVEIARFCTIDAKWQRRYPRQARFKQANSPALANGCRQGKLREASPRAGSRRRDLKKFLDRHF